MKRTALYLVLALALFAIGPISQGQDDRGFQVVVHADNPATSVERSRLSKMFLKKIKRWDGGDTPVVPIDLGDKSPVREAFTRAVHKKSIGAIKSFWQRQIFSGRDVPPDEVASDEEVLQRVAANPAAVGYVASGAPLGDGVKVLEVAY